MPASLAPRRTTITSAPSGMAVPPTPSMVVESNLAFAPALPMGVMLDALDCRVRAARIFAASPLSTAVRRASATALSAPAYSCSASRSAGSSSWRMTALLAFACTSSSTRAIRAALAR